jgi:hypothetical protein
MACLLISLSLLLFLSWKSKVTSIIGVVHSMLSNPSVFRLLCSKEIVGSTKQPRSGIVFLVAIACRLRNCLSFEKDLHCIGFIEIGQPRSKGETNPCIYGLYGFMSMDIMASSTPVRTPNATKLVICTHACSQHIQARSPLCPKEAP